MNASFDRLGASIAALKAPPILPQPTERASSTGDAPASVEQDSAPAVVTSRSAIKLPEHWRITPIPRGKKGPTSPGWNRPERMVAPQDWPDGMNAGLCHVESRTCAIDFDDLALARSWLATHGIDADELLSAPDAVRISSGRPNRAKLIYRLDEPLRSLKFSGGDDESKTILEFRCATSKGLSVQDVLPGSVHPDTGKPYTWDFDELFVSLDDLPVIPEPLRQLWLSLLAPRTATAPAVPAATYSIERIRELLLQLSSDIPRATWVSYLMAVHHGSGGSEEALDLVDEWSRGGGARYTGRESVESAWRSFKAGDNSVTMATIEAAVRAKASADLDQFEDITRGQPESAPNKIKAAIEFRHISDIIAERREPEWLLLDVLEAKVLAVLAGPRGSFKSFIATHWAHLAAMAGHAVVLLSGEGAGLDRRSAAWFQVHAPRSDPAKLPLLALERVLNLNAEDTVKALAHAIQSMKQPARLIVIDTLSKYSAGLDENDNAQMARFLSRLAVRVRDQFGCAVLLVAHSGHSDPSRPRGASSLMANPDAEYVVARPEAAGMLVTVTRDRFKDTPSLSPLAYTLESVDLGRTDRQGRPVTSLVPRETAAPCRLQTRAPRTELQRRVLKVALDLLAERLTGEPVPSTEIITTAVAGLTPPEEGRRNTLRFNVRNALDRLVLHGFLTQKDGLVGAP